MESAIDRQLPAGGALLALAAILPAPTLGLIVVLHVWPDSVVGQAVYAGLKVWLLLVPAAWVWLIDRHPLRLPPLRARGIGEGLVTGGLIFAVIVAAYWLLGDWVNVDAMARQIEAVGLGDPMIYLFAALYWCTINSLLEEYVWRWFVFTRCEMLMPRIVAVLAAGLFFTLHHVVALAYYFDWRVTLLGSVGVFIGGTAWSWLYLRWRNIYAAYLSHVCADLAVFGVGWHLLFVNN